MNHAFFDPLKPNRSYVRLLFVASIASAGWMLAPNAGAADPSYSLACAKRDLELVALIEAQGDSQEVGTATLSSAYLDVIRARDACEDGRVEEGLAIYNKTFTFLLETAAHADDE
jgi:hypothetical protein